MKVLVIEDDPTVGAFIKRGLEEQRWGVQLVTDGEEGEQIAATETFDVIILDMRLPGKSGLDVLQGLRARGFEKPVLVLTAQDAVDAKVRTLRAGASQPVPARLHLASADGHPLVPSTGIVRLDSQSGLTYVYSDGTLTLTVPPGGVRIVAARGRRTAPSA